MLTREEVDQLDCIEMDEFDYIKPESVYRFAKAIYRRAIEDAAQACIDSDGHGFSYCLREIRKLGEVE